MSRLSTDELFDVAERAGLLILNESTTPEILRVRIMRASLEEKK